MKSRRYLGLPGQVLITLLLAPCLATIDSWKDNLTIGAKLGRITGEAIGFCMGPALVGLAVRFLMRFVAKRNPAQIYLWVAAAMMLIP